MPRRSESGKFIFSASEIAEFTVCPQAWFLGRMTKATVPETVSKKAKEGEKLHKQWAQDYAEGLSLARWLRLLVALMITATMVVLLQSK